MSHRFKGKSCHIFYDHVDLSGEVCIATGTGKAAIDGSDLLALFQHLQASSGSLTAQKPEGEGVLSQELLTIASDLYDDERRGKIRVNDVERTFGVGGGELRVKWRVKK